MSDVDDAVDGAEAASLPDEPQVQEEQPQETAAAEVEPEEEAPKPKRDGGFQRRINQLTWEKRELERQLSEARTPQTKQAPPDANADPVEYVRHLAQEEARKLYEESRRSESEQRKQQEFEQTQAKFLRNAEQFAESKPDFWDAVQALDATVPMSAEIVYDVIGQSDVGPALTYYLAQHMDEAAEIAKLPTHVAAARIARIEAKLTAPKVKPTNTPTPPPRLGGSATPVKDLGKLSYADYKAQRMKGQS